MLNRFSSHARHSAVVEFCWFSLQHLLDRVLRPRVSSSAAVAERQGILRREGLVKLGRLEDSRVLELRRVLDGNVGRDKERRPGEDLRAWGVESHIPSWKDLGEELRALVSEHVGRRWEIATVMGNLVPPESNSEGSGGGWHRDSNAPQYKIMIFLSDVRSVDDGAFSYLPGSHRYLRIARSFNSDGRWRDKGTRWDEQHIARQAVRLRPALGISGEIIMFDGSMIHRGAPNIRESNRWALTLYLFPAGKMPTHLRILVGQYD